MQRMSKMENNKRSSINDHEKSREVRWSCCGRSTEITSQDDHMIGLGDNRKTRIRRIKEHKTFNAIWNQLNHRYD